MDPSEVALAETKFAPEPDTDLHTGLTTAQVAERLAKYGPNEVVTEEEPEWKKIVSRYCGVVPLIMLATSLLSIAVVTRISQISLFSANAKYFRTCTTMLMIGKQCMHGIITGTIIDYTLIRI